MISYNLSLFHIITIIISSRTEKGLQDPNFLDRFKLTTKTKVNDDDIFLAKSS